MKKQPTMPLDAANLRRRAEARLRGKPKTPPSHTPQSAIRDPQSDVPLLHELQVHQIELEMQNAELRAAQAAVTVALERYTDFYDFAPAGFLSLGRGGAIRQLNLAGARLLGLSRDQLVGARFGPFVVKADRPAFNTFLGAVFATRTKQACEVTLQRAGQPPLTVALEATLSPDERECRAVLVDITAHKRMEEELLFRDRAIDSAAQGITISDRRLPNHPITYVNHGFEKMTGYTRAEVIGKSLGLLQGPGSDPKTSAALSAAVAEGRSVETEILNYRKDGTPFWNRLTVAPVRSPGGPATHYVGVRSDVTERKWAEEALRESEALFKTIAANTPDYIAIQDRRLRHLFVANPQLGLTEQDMIGKTDRDFLSKEDADKLIKIKTRVLETGQPVHLATSLISRAGQPEFFEGSYVPRFDTQGRVLGLIGYFRNVTERKQAEELSRIQHDLALALAAGSNLQVGLRLCLEAAIKVTHSDSGGFYLVDERTGALDVRAHQGLSPEFVQDVLHYDAGSDHTRLVMAGKPIYGRYPDLGLALTEAERREGLRFLAVIPIRQEGRVVGCLNVASHTVDDIAPAACEALETIAAEATHAIARLKMEAALRALSSRHEAILSAVPDIIVEVDTNKVLVWMNDAGFEFYADDALGKEAAFYFEGPQDTYHTIQPVFDGNTNVIYVESWQRRRDGEKRLLAWWCRVLKDANGNVTGALSTARDITGRKRAEEALRDLSRRLLKAQDEERRRIAKELHDSTAQDLVAVMMSLDELRESIAERGDNEVRQLEDSMAILEKCAHDIRTLSYVLHPPRLDEAGLVGAIRHYADGFGERSGIAITLELPQDLGRLAEDVELILFRVMQECLGNIHRHAHSPTAVIRLARDAAALVLEISDAGGGLPPALLETKEGAPPGLGVGIPGMRERLRQIGGRLDIESNSRGTTVRAILPVV